MCSLLLMMSNTKRVFKNTNDEFHVRVAKEPEEIKEFLGIGFGFLYEKDDLLYFRKRK